MVSAIITTYKRPPEMVIRAAKSILNQTYEDLELIIVDDSPSDYELRNAVKEASLSLGDRVTYIAHEENMGACTARNTGIKNAKGEFVSFLDDDDIWFPEKIEKQMKVIEKDPDIALVYCGRNTYYEKENRTVPQKINFKKGYVFDKLFLNNFIGSTSLPLIRKDILIKMGGFDAKMPAAQDFETWLRIAKHYKIDYIKEPLVLYYVHEHDQITKDPSKKIKGYKYIEDAYCDYLAKHPRTHAIRLLMDAKLIANIDLKEAKKVFIKAFLKFPFAPIELLRAFKWIYIVPKYKK